MAPEVADRNTPKEGAQPPSLSPIDILRRVAIPLVLIAGVGAWYGHSRSSPAAMAVAQPTDTLSAADARQRQLAFEALGSLDIQPVASDQTDAAVDGMGLDPHARQALVNDLAVSPAAPDAAQPSPESQPVARVAKPLRLAWVTLWDTDVEDGDIVRIDSEGYSRTIVLSKHGATFAIPVPQSGVITIKGIDDGDGGGITVGLASGDAKAVLPIMSPGQTLRLAVVIR